MNGAFPKLPVDPFAETLQLLRPVGALYSRCHFTAPWGLDIPAFDQSVMFHVVLSGSCWLQSKNAPPRRLESGALVLMPRGEGHLLSSDLRATLVPLFDLPREYVSERYELLTIDGGGEAVEMLCGTVRFDHPAARQLIMLLPRIVCLEEGDSLHDDWLRSTVALIAAEASTLRAGSEAIITRLADIVVIQTIRAWIERDPGARTGWLHALRDRQIGRALALIHRDPARSWTLASLAEAVAMSRSAFAARFSELVGATVMQYMTRWRMHVAFTLLQERDARVADLAQQFGYESEAAFSRAFKRCIGVPPGAVKRGSQLLRATVGRSRQHWYRGRAYSSAHLVGRARPTVLTTQEWLLETMR